MPVRFLVVLTALLLTAPQITFAEDAVHSMSEADMDAHSTQFAHAFRLETDYGAGKQGPVSSWDLRGWVGGDVNKIWLRSEGETDKGNTEQSEFWALYSRNIATFWDAQAGIRYDTAPRGRTYLALGFTGLAPYYFETEAHIFVSDNGNMSARLREENDFLITQYLITQPYAEINLSMRDEAADYMNAGFSRTEIGLQTRYEITRKFAPYLDVRYDHRFGDALPRDEGNNGFIASVGLRLMF